jgi:hypothetical protein
LPRAGLRERDPLARAVFFAAPRLAEVFGEDFFAAFFAAPLEAFFATLVARAATFDFFVDAADFVFRALALIVRRLPALALRRGLGAFVAAGAGAFTGGAASGSGSARSSSFGPPK